MCGFLANVLGSRLAKCLDNGQVLGKKAFIKSQSVRMCGVELILYIGANIFVDVWNKARLNRRMDRSSSECECTDRSFI